MGFNSIPYCIKKKLRPEPKIGHLTMRGASLVKGLENSHKLESLKIG